MPISRCCLNRQDKAIIINKRVLFIAKQCFSAFLCLSGFAINPRLYDFDNFHLRLGFRLVITLVSVIDDFIGRLGFWFARAVRYAGIQSLQSY